MIFPREWVIMLGFHRTKTYRGATIGEIRAAFAGRFDVEPDVLEQLGKEWEQWKHSEAPDGGAYRDSFLVMPEGNFYRVRLNRAVFSGCVDDANFIGRVTEEIIVYRNCMAPNAPIYMKRE